MKKTYCDRCGKEVERWKFITNEKCLRYAGRIGPNPKFISDNPVDLCADCQQILDEYCNHFMKELKENE